jgi:DNA repair exonuclease SbcCD ATPase subunit
MNLAPALSCDAVRETFRAWNAERDSLDSELSESLTALEAYQLHLDGWQQQLARERGELQCAREQFEHDRAAWEKNDSEASAATNSELHTAREKITALTTLLLNRTEELRTLDNRRAEVQTELELSRARERELKAALDEQKRSVDEERSEWSEELKQLRGALEHQLETPVVAQPIAVVERSAPPTPVASAAPARTRPSGDDQTSHDNPLLGSIVAQFGKLRQQRAVERQAHNRQR